MTLSGKDADLWPVLPLEPDRLPRLESGESVPLVSVIVITRNRRQELAECLNSLFQQTLRGMEIWVLDNGSEDGTNEYVAQTYPSVHLLRMPRNYGDWEGRDICLGNCRGKYILCMDDDATAGENALEKLIGAMEREPKAAVVQAMVRDSRNNEFFYCGPDRRNVHTNHYMANFLGGAALYRREDLMRAGRFPHYLLGGAELYLTLRFLENGRRICYCADAEINHLYSPGQRVRHERLFLSSKQRMHATMALFPYGWRLWLEFFVKMASYIRVSLKDRYVLTLPWDLLKLTRVAISGLGCKARVRMRTIDLFDYLTIHSVFTESEYEGIPLNRHYLAQRFAWRFRQK